MSKSRLPFVPTFDESDTIPISYRNPYEWIESSYVDSHTSQTEFIGRTVSEKHITILHWMMVFIIIVCVGKSAYLQIFKGTGFAVLAERNKTRIVTLQAHRGIFFDKNHTILVHNTPDFSLIITPVDLPKDEELREEAFDILSHGIALDPHRIKNEIAQHNRYQPFLLADHIAYEQALRLEVALRDVRGIELAISETRSYQMTPFDSISHIVGYTGRISEEQYIHHPNEYTLTDSIGKSGLEKAYENVIRGVSGKKEIEVDALGHEKGIISERPGQDGNNLILSLDWKIQEKAESILAAVMKQSGKQRGVVIASNPNNGELLAYVSLPSYDANMFSKGIQRDTYDTLINDPHRPLLSRGTSGEYPSGSTIKMIVAAAALQEGIVTKSSTVVSTGGIHIGEWFFPDWKAGGHGVTNVIKALAESVNTYFYIVGGGYRDKKGLGADMLIAYFKKFGIGEETHVDFQQERPGFLPDPAWKAAVRKEPWYIGDTYHSAIGQGDILVTPLQVNEYTSYFAAKGVNFKPHIVHAIESGDGIGGITELKPEIYKSNLVSPETVAIIREGLRAGVTSGSSRRLLTLPVESAGKTGTAQWSSSKSPHAWFTGWAPYTDAEIVVTVLIEEGEEGSRTAMTVAHDFLQWYFKDYKKK